MKTLILLMLAITVTARAEVTVDDCLQDALTFANHTHPVAPLPECATLLDADADKVEGKSGVNRAYGKSHMVYVETPDEDGKGIERNLLSGDQTELASIRKLFIDAAANRLYVVQVHDDQNELLVFRLDFIGNVTPLNVMRANALFSGVSSIRTSGTNQIEVVNGNGAFLINADAETRASRSVQKALTITPK